MDRGKKILVAIYIALGFLLLRQLFAFFFNGLEGERTILALPEYQLPRPFSQITILGEVSTDGILRNLELSIPFFFTILFFGVAAAFISQTWLIDLAGRIPVAKNLINAVALSLGVIPAIFEAGKKVLSALSLRGEKRSRILVPILERSVELASALGLRLAMESKPAAGKAGIRVVDFQVTGLRQNELSFDVAPGQMVLLSGATGSGKTTLLEAIAGILEQYRGRQYSGEIQIGDSSARARLSTLSSFVGFVSQNPRDQALGLSVNDLVKDVDPKLVRLFDLDSLSGPTAQLSEGEIFKLVFASVLARKPSVLLLDEPFDALDQQAKQIVVEILNGYISDGNSALITEHEPENLPGLNASRIFISDLGIEVGSYQPRVKPMARVQPVVGSDLALEVALPEISRRKKLLEPTTIRLQQADCVWLSGPNGCGKSTLLDELAKLSMSNHQGSKAQVPRNIALVPENFDDFFLTDTLLAELERADRIAGVEKGFTFNTLRSILPGQLLDKWQSIHPRDLSRGTRLSLAISMQLSHKPKVLLIDEPFRGLDPIAKEQLCETLRCVLETGCAILFASHERAWASKLAHRRLEIANHVVLEREGVSA